MLLYESSFQASTPNPLKLSTILDSGTTIHVFNDLSRFHNFRKAPHHHYLIAGNREVPILGYGEVDIDVTRPNRSKGTLRLKNVAFCTDFATNLVSFRLLREKGIIGITRAITTVWHGRTTRSCARCRRFMGNRSLTTYRSRAAMPLSRVASPAVNAGSPESLPGIRDQLRREMPSSGTFEWDIQDP